MRYLGILLVVLILVSGCAHINRRPVYSQMVGSWYGEKSLYYEKLNGNTQKWMVTRESDGRLTVHLKMYDDVTGKLVAEQVESGEWWMEDDIYVNKISKMVRHGSVISPKTPDGYYVEKFRMVRLTGTESTYRSIREDIVFTLNRVSPEHAF